MGDISCGKDYDLSPYAAEIAVASTYVTASTSTYVTASVLSFEQFEPMPLVIKLSEFTETNKKSLASLQRQIKNFMLNSTYQE